jgi:lysyl-tRNA synthetase class 2
VWRPTASLYNLEQRAKILKKIRHFFEERGVLEVETPLLYQSSATDPLLQSFTTILHLPAKTNQVLYLQTSPEFPMKRLLAAGYGSVYQITKAFRNGEIGKKHNPEFTLLEWYRVAFTQEELMQEIEAFLQRILGIKETERISYRALFEYYFGFNPHVVTLDELQDVAKKFQVNFQATHEADKDVWLNLLLTHIIEPELGQPNPIFLYDYPASQAALARIRLEENYYVGERFELYYKGMELANGYHELNDAKEQKARFENDNHARSLHDLPCVPADNFLLEALPFFPDCAGVALGIDRLICLALQKYDIAEVITFPISRV